MGETAIRDLTIPEFKNLVREAVCEALGELLTDPDEGLELREEFVAQLKESVEAVKAGEKTSPLDVVAKNLGLD